MHKLTAVALSQGKLAYVQIPFKIFFIKSIKMRYNLGRHQFLQLIKISKKSKKELGKKKIDQTKRSISLFELNQQRLVTDSQIGGAM
jgi:hypothetical protein